MEKLHINNLLPILRQSSMKDICRLLSRSLEFKETPDFNSLSNTECKTYAVEHFREFLEKGVDYYIRNNSFKEVNDFYKKYCKKNPQAATKLSHPMLHAYYTFIGALHIQEPREFDIDSLEECVNEISFLFDEFLKQGARAFATRTYIPIPNDYGFFMYHTEGGPMRPEVQKKIHEICVGTFEDTHGKGSWNNNRPFLPTHTKKNLLARIADRLGIIY
jgi:hypothetical protein